MTAMRSLPLSSVAKIDRASLAPEKIQSGTAYLGLEHIESGGKILGAQPVDSGELKSSKFRFTSQHILYGKLRPYLAKIALPDFDGICSTDIIPILPGPDIDRKYLLYFLRQGSMVDYANSRSSGANLPRLSPKELANFQVPLPPLEEQKRIAKILDAAYALRTKRRESLAQLDALLQSTFLKLFGDPTSVNAGQNQIPLKDVVKLENGDRSSSYPSGDEIQSEGILFLSTKNIVADQLDLTRCNFISKSKFDTLGRGKLRRGDLVITLRGTLGSCAIFDCDFDTGFINAQMLIIRPTEGILSQFIHGLLTTRAMKRRLKYLATGVAVKQLTAKQIGELVIPLPAIEKQQEFAAIVDHVGEQKRRLLSHEIYLEELFESLQQLAFSGEL